MSKICFMTMDVESFYDITCLKDKNIQPVNEYNGKEGIKKYLDLLNKYHIKGTFFITCDFVKECHDYIEEIISSGHEVALHAFTHIPPKRLSIEEFRKQLIEAKEYLKNEFDIDVVGYRAPCFGLSDDYLEVLKELGFKYDSSALNYTTYKEAGKIDLNNKKMINDIIYQEDELYEFSLPKSNILWHSFPISGGGYVRMFIWKIVKRKINKFIKTHDSYLFYVHPFELTDDLVKIKEINIFEKMYLKRGRKKFYGRIEEIIQLLKDNNYEFLTMSNFIEKGRE